MKHKTSSGLTLLSLVISFTGIIILTLYVSWEKSFDRFHENADSVYRLETIMHGSSVPAMMGQVIKEKIPEIDQLTALWSYNSKITTPKLKDTDVGFQSKILFAEDGFFDIFSFPLTIGDKKSALTASHSAIVSESLSLKIFGNKSPIGENLLINGIQYKITGVMKDFPKNSSFHADCLLSFSTSKNEPNLSHFNKWNEWSFTIFMKLHPGSHPDSITNKIVNIEDFSQYVEQMKTLVSGDGKLIELRPLSQIHFVPERGNYTVNPVILNIFIFLIVILAVMGAVNFINFASSQAPLRAKALSVARVMGRKRLSLMSQIIFEAVLLSFVAMAVSLLIYRISCSYIETFWDIQGLHLTGRYYFLVLFLLFAIGFGILAGFYPSRYITSSPIAQTLKGKIHFSGKGKSFRNTLVTIQFIFTIVLIASAFVIEKQLIFWRNFDIGIDKEHVVYLPTTYQLKQRSHAFANELVKNKYINDYTYTQFIPGNVQMGWGRYVDGQYIQMKCWPVDERFLDFFGIQIEEGRHFFSGVNSDINTFIINEKGLEKFGWDNPLQRQISGFDFNGRILGVARNFNFSSLKEDVEPMVFWRTNWRKDHLLLRLSPGNYTQTIAFIESTAQKFDPKYPVEVRFLNDALDELYTKEEKMGRFIEFVALWTILLAITGLLGLIIFISRDRVKEIGIRKVNGARISEVMVMLNKDFIKWVAIAFVIATPLAWYAMQKWLQNFAYKTELSWWIFALAGLLALGIALLTVSWQSWKAARRNPVESLRNE